MVIGQIAEQADLVVAGSGPGGYIAAIRAAQLGRKVTLIERAGEDGIGGVCLNVGCIPSKALIEAADQAHRIGEASAMGIKATYQGIDMVALQSWKREIVKSLTNGVRGLLKQAGVRVMKGEFRFTRPDEGAVAITGMPANFVKFNDFIIATGSRPVTLPGFLVDQKMILDSTGALDLEEVPKSVAIIGGGYIGLEIGIALAKLGSRVSIVEALDGILPTMDRRLVKPVEKRLAALRVEVFANAKAKSFDKGTLLISTSSGDKTVAAEKVIVAVGRRPNTDDLSLERTGFKPDGRGLMAVQPDRRIGPHIAAIGDITPGPALAHKAMAEGVVAAEALSGKKVAFQPQAIPAVIFSDPEIATAGMTMDEAKAAGIETELASFPMAASGRAKTLNAHDGFIQIVADRDRKSVVGVQVVGPHASDLIAEGVLAIEMGASLDDIALTIHAHPTLSELYLEAAHVGIGHPIHIGARVKK
ncbi:MAG: dihydrolipoyl dehydrogenase [Alphaproteobacteria bacterium]|nr:dihydrolipoyl dehydrogenase [Alphaproteobacteria bacterium]